METNSGAPDLTDANGTGSDSGRAPRSRIVRRILSDDQIAGLSLIPDHKLTLKYIYETYGVTKRELLRSYVSMEIENAPVNTKDLVQWLELTFPEDIRTAVVRDGQDRLAEMIDALAGEIFALNVAVTELIAELRARPKV